MVTPAAMALATFCAMKTTLRFEGVITAATPGGSMTKRADGTSPRWGAYDAVLLGHGRLEVVHALVERGTEAIGDGYRSASLVLEKSTKVRTDHLVRHNSHTVF
jgi:hypothetical protein